MTVAMLLDTAPSLERSPVAAGDKERPVERPHPFGPARRRRQDQQTGPALRSWFSVSAGGLLGVIGSVAPELSAEAGVGLHAFRIGLGGLWGPPRQLGLTPGYVSESLGAGTLRICWNQGSEDSISPGLCVGAILGEIHGEAHGFMLNEDHRRPWLALPVEVSLAKLNGTFGWEVTASALVEVVEHDFVIAGVGPAYRAPVLGGIVALRGIVNFLR
ncbi:MAG TPA: hypothetical protein VNW92_24200 [Polyangiaceae bacterium]|nr:hypothetical protein [Polyangiaceae bacterium]